MNHVYRLCWNRSSAQWVPACEFARSTSPAPSRARVIGPRTAWFSVLAMYLGMTGLACASATGGQITAGSGQITQSGNTTTIQQSSQNLSLNWQSFNIGSNQTVDFVQPGSSSIAVNRILGSTGSTILGHLNANGQVWLINPNGIIFGQGAQVNVGGLVASTLDVNDSDLGSNTRTFSGNGKGSVVNQGTLNAADGGYIALLGNQVSNQGVVSARLGTVALGAGSAETLTFQGNQLLHLQVDQSTLDNLAENRQIIQADGGQVIMTAGAKDALLASLVNNTGVVRAQTVENHNGTITLLGGMASGTVNVGGTLDASAPNGGNGGSIETSAANFKLASSALITAGAKAGKAGTWLVDPTDLDINPGDETALDAALNGGTSVTLTTSATGAPTGGFGTPVISGTTAGDINVNTDITWTNAAASLTLSAYHGIAVNDTITGAGGLNLTAATGPISINAATQADTGVTMNTAAGAINVGAAVNSAATVAMHAIGGNFAIAAGGSITGGTGATLGTSANFTNAAGAAAVTATTGNWLIYSTNPTLDTAGGLTPSFVQYNAPFGTAALGTGNGFLYSLAPTITITGLTGNVAKTYDGTTAATLALGNVTTSGLVNGDALNALALSGTYASSNAATGISVTSAASPTSFGVTTTGGLTAYGYQFAAGAKSANIGTINPLQLIGSIVGNPTKVYDGTTTATLNSSNYSFNFVAGQGATVSQPSSVAYAGVDAGPETITATLRPTNFTANAGTNFANYILPTTATGPGTITQAPLNILNLLATDKVYDGTTTDALNTTNAALSGVIPVDNGNVTLNAAGATGDFSQANVGNNLAVIANLATFSIGGSAANNYMLIAPQGLSADITPKALTVIDATAANKIYDGTTTAALDVSGATLSGLVTGDTTVTLADGSAAGSFSQSDVGNALTVTTSGFNLAGTGTGNYTLSQPVLTANITPKMLTIALDSANAPTKIYDGTDAANLTTGNFDVSGFIAGQSGSVAQASGTYNSPNVLGATTVTTALQASDFAVGSGTKLSNYSFPATVNGAGSITPAPLDTAIVNNPTKTYDGTNTATLTQNNLGLSGAIGSEQITVNNGTYSGAYATVNAGTQNVTATLTAGDLTFANGAIASNYILPLVFNGLGTIVPAALGISASINGATKVYDGTTDITLLPGNFVLSGFVNGDSAVINQNIDGTFANKNAGTGIALTATLADADFTFTPGTDAGNYTYPVIAYGTGSITPRPLTVTLGSITKVYDGTSSAQLNSANFTVDTGVAGESFTITPTAAFNYNTPNVSATTVSGTLTGNNYTGTGGALKSNYVLDYAPTGSGTITPAPLFITGVYGTDKVYDTTNADPLNVTNAALAGLVDTDTGDVTLSTSGNSGQFGQVNVGTGLSVTASGFTISGTQAGNYNLMQPTGLFANITAKSITVTGVTAENKPYDATNTATLDTAAAALSGVFAQDTANVDLSTIGTGVFNNVNAGNRLVNTSGFAIDGTASGNYTLVQPGPLAATITPRQLTANITGTPTKAYDGSNSATLTAADYTLGGFVAGQGATVPQSATANYASPNAGNNLEVDSTLVSSDFLANSGTNLANYVLPTSGQGFNGVITPYVLNLSGTRVYDALTDANGNLFGTLTGLNGDTLTVDGSGVTGSKNVGTYTAASAAPANFQLGSLGLVSAGNGAIATNYTLVGGADKFVITKATLNVIDGSAANKIYDGTTAAAVSGAQLSGVLLSDVVALTNPTKGTFNSKNVNATSVTTAAGISGTDSGNYILVQQSGILATISPLAITIIATGANKIYDGTTADSGLTVGLSSSTPLATGDTLTYTFGSAAFADPNVNDGILINVANTAAHGAAVTAGDYTFNTSAVTAANITPRPITLNSTRLYDGTTDADASLFTVNTGVAGQALTLTGSGVLDGKDVGTQAFNSLGTLALVSGTGSASNYTLSPFTADTVTINPLILDLTGKRAYDGLTDAAGGLFGTINGIGGETLTVAGSGVTGSKNVGSYASAGTAPNTFTLGTLGLVGDAGTAASDYTLIGGVDNFTITPLAINVATTAPDKTYDSTTTSTITLMPEGVIPGDNISFASGPSNFASPNAGPGTVTTVNIAATGTDASNYSYNTTSTTPANILPALITLNATRPYDGTTSADASLFTIGGTLTTGIAGQTLTLTGSGTLDSKNAALEDFAGLGSLTLGGNNGSLASNYTLGTGTGDTVDVTPLNITVSAAAANKVYDGTTTAAVTLTGNGVIAGDNLSFTDSSANFVNPNVVGNETVNVLGITGSGKDLANYNILNTSATATAMITPVPIVLQSTRVYDGLPDAAASLFLTGGTLAGIPGQTLTLTGSGVLTTKNVGSQQPFQSLGTLALGNGTGTASNYTLSPISNDWVTITPLALNITATGSNKTYDGSNAATVALTGNGVLPGDQLSFTDGSATFASPNAGNGIAIAVSGISGSGADLGNYTFNTTATTAANITPAILNLNGTRTYDGATDASANLFGNNGVLTGVNGETLTLGGTGVVSTKNVGTNLPFAPGGLAGFTLTGDGSALASNYTFVGGTDTLTITPALLQVIGTVGTNRVYNGLTGDTLSGSMLSGLFGNDAVALGNDTSGTFDSKNVGNNKPITTAMTISGGDAGNYILVQPTGIAANVTPLGITVNAIGKNKRFDGNSNATVTLNSTGVLPGDAVGFNYLTALFSDPNVGNNKSIAVNGITDTGADAGNYMVLDPDTTTTANITNATGNSAVNGAIAQAQWLLWPHAIATPYGTATTDTVSDYTGNHKKNQDQTQPIEPNVNRSDFRPGIALKVIGGGVRLPADAPL
ncbi:YDG domain-containing protein [Rhodanobacter sp. MP1X3]|uniref:YDG domain-containing protein n=1 Tax=Rhodanobacter sp. MP1X3 TaxID=2723086 RepID=UPI0016224337|nr:YDG domain-containing protein [Rhodanobacter sp. MP1X3]MBB6243195.1 filamentous hemagglutinin family protein [Rhodanobacter sp. MP1X3]